MSVLDIWPILLFTLLCVTLCAGGIYVNTRRSMARERARIVELASEIFGDKQKMARWLHKPLQRFNGKTPHEMLKSSHGLEEVEQLLIELQEGYF